MKRAGGFLAHAIAIAVLTIISQIGGIAWLLALRSRRRVIAFAAIYVALSIAAIWIAPVFGRVALPCFAEEGLRMHSAFYCALNRRYVTPPVLTTLRDVHSHMAHTYPDTETLLLDANFPFISGFPMLPHLSHDDGMAVDIAFYYKDGSGYLPGRTRSPIGYFAFEDGPTECPNSSISLRWDLEWLQPLWPDWVIEQNRTQHLLRALNADPRVGKVFIEPHLKSTLGVRGEKLRFQGCRAARHDDHIHVQLR